MLDLQRFTGDIARTPLQLNYQPGSAPTMEVTQPPVENSVASTGDAFNLPPIYPEWLGDRAFSVAHGCRFNYVTGEMARGIATPRMVINAVKAGCMGFYGSAGLPLNEIEAGLIEIKDALTDKETAWGANLIHSPQAPDQESVTIDLFLKHGVRRVSASAFMTLSADVVRYTALGLSRAKNGSIKRDNHVFAKVSRAEVAERFMAPAPEKMLQALVANGEISALQAELASKVPVAIDITAEADSGGHTDNRAAAPLFSSLSLACDRVCNTHKLNRNQFRIGLAGGLATPQSLAGAFAMGAAYVVTGSINQSSVESGLSRTGRQLLAKSGPSDVAMAPAADMFEQGVDVQVLKRGTLFPMRAKKLYALYRSGKSYETLSQEDQLFLEACLGEPFEAAWASTQDYTRKTNPREAEKAEKDANKRLALVARKYLFDAAQWARTGVAERAVDYQIWCGPAMGTFNEWVAGTFLEPIDNRSVAQIAWNLMEGAAQITRAQQLRTLGADVPPTAFSYTPRQITQSEQIEHAH